MLRETLLFLKRKLVATRRNPVFIFMSFTTPLLYLLLYAPLLKNIAPKSALPTEDVLTMFVPGMLTLLAFGSGIFVGFGIIEELRSGVIERFRVSPVSRFAIMLGMVLHDIIVTCLSMLFFIGVAFLWGFRIHSLGLLLMIPLLSMLVTTAASLSYAIGLITKDEDQLAPVTHGLNLPLTLLSGMILPINLGPTWLKTIAAFNPIYYVVEACRHLTVGDFTHNTVWIAFLYMGVVTMMVMRWCTKVFSKAVM